MTQKELHAAARKWANDNGIPVGKRGRVSTVIIEAYRKAADSTSTSG